MVSELFFDNKKYITVKDAARLTAYSKDYVGQLCRHNKVDSRRVGHTWYVGEESLLAYKSTPTTFDFSKNFQGRESKAVQTTQGFGTSNATSNGTPITSNSVMSKALRVAHEGAHSFHFGALKQLAPLVMAIVIALGIISFYNTFAQSGSKSFSASADSKNLATSESFASVGEKKWFATS